MIFGDPKNIAITYEVLARQPDSHFAFGTFNIFIDDRLLLKGGSNWTIDCLVSHLRNTKQLIDTKNEKMHKDELFHKACTSRGYQLHNARRITTEQWESNDPAVIKEVEDHFSRIEILLTQPPFGAELPMYVELLDLEVRVFLFANVDYERIIYSLDLGKKIIEKVVPKGTVNAFVLSLPKVV